MSDFIFRCLSLTDQVRQLPEFFIGKSYYVLLYIILPSDRVSLHQTRKLARLLPQIIVDRVLDYISEQARGLHFNQPYLPCHSPSKCGDGPVAEPRARSPQGKPL